MESDINDKIHKFVKKLPSSIPFEKEIDYVWIFASIVYRSDIDEYIDNHPFISKRKLTI